MALLLAYRPISICVMRIRDRTYNSVLKSVRLSPFLCALIWPVKPRLDKVLPLFYTVRPPGHESIGNMLRLLNQYLRGTD
jgi:hypothetical protein